MWIALAVVAAIVLWFVLTYNTFVKLRGFVQEAFSGMDVYLKKRYDLIPNLVETVRRYMSHEEQTLTRIVELRSIAAGAATPQDKLAAEGELSGAIGRLFAVAESYPQLMSSEQFISLQNELTGVEDQIAQARKYYNGAVRQYNVKTQTIPSSLVAGICGFKAMPYFESSEQERQNVKVDFGQ